MRTLRKAPRSLRAALAVGLALALLLAWAAAAGAQSGGGYDLTWNTFDGGGATFSTGGGYSLGGTIGQADAGALSGGGYELGGGFWAGVEAVYRYLLPLLLNSE